ncbi:50S ribosomal protein L4 [Candidatus Berkelbacteria bacterium]|nr:50S ribosomal protein L4 [Candidatus Berkelbacteria bacterium]
MAKSINKNLIKQAVVASLANVRQSTSHTKTRAKVSGGGRKPWRQKGTGRARAGSSRSPIWVGGGITFGPTNERNFKQHLPIKMRKSAITEILKVLNDAKKIIIVDSVNQKEIKTKIVAKLLADHDLTGKNVTIVTSVNEKNLVISARNIEGLTVVENKDLSVLSIANAYSVIFEKAAAIERGLIKEVTEPKAKPATTTKTKKAK